MTKTREEILSEARSHIAAGKDLQQPVQPPRDQLDEWRRWHTARADERDAATAERKRIERRDRRALAESASVTALRAEIAAEIGQLRKEIDTGDAGTLAVTADVVLPLVEKIADRMQAAIDRIEESVSRRLAVLEEEVRSAVKMKPSEAADLLRDRRVN
jgi:hypothetical protein